MRGRCGRHWTGWRVEVTRPAEIQRWGELTVHSGFVNLLGRHEVIIHVDRKCCDVTGHVIPGAGVELGPLCSRSRGAGERRKAHAARGPGSGCGTVMAAAWKAGVPSRLRHT